MTELRRLQRATEVTLAAFVLAVALALLLARRADLLSGLLTGALIGLINLRWLIGSARRMMGTGVSARLLQAASMLRWLAVGGILGAALVVGHVHPVGAVIGYGLLPLAAAAAGIYVLRGTA